MQVAHQSVIVRMREIGGEREAEAAMDMSSFLRRSHVRTQFSEAEPACIRTSFTSLLRSASQPRQPTHTEQLPQCTAGVCVRACVHVCMHASVRTSYVLACLHLDGRIRANRYADSRGWCFARTILGFQFVFFCKYRGHQKLRLAGLRRFERMAQTL